MYFLPSQIDPNAKRLKLAYDSPISNLPIKATHVCYINEQIHKMNKYGGSTAVLGRPYYEDQKYQSSSQSHSLKLWRVLFDSGMD